MAALRQVFDERAKLIGLSTRRGLGGDAWAAQSIDHYDRSASSVTGIHESRLRTAHQGFDIAEDQHALHMRRRVERPGDTSMTITVRVPNARASRARTVMFSKVMSTPEDPRRPS